MFFTGMNDMNTFIVLFAEDKVIREREFEDRNKEKNW